MQHIFIALVRAYQIAISPLLGSNCRHEPSCSAYSIEAFKVWGAWTGLFLTIKRISKCHPWGTSGKDPVPPKNI
ncbi:MAG: membrane protein insertion efficiency factor YidD [Euryarchaeota archaeon]|nr:membrane protein insertion efficiency factor YidD [Euryarchaeota archaeon]